MTHYYINYCKDTLFHGNVRPIKCHCVSVAMDKAEAFEIVSKIVFDRAVQLVIAGNPAFDSELVLFHLEMVMIEWGYKSAIVAEYYDSLKEENDHFREMGIQ